MKAGYATPHGTRFFSARRLRHHLTVPVAITPAKLAIAITATTPDGDVQVSMTGAPTSVVGRSLGTGGPYRSCCSGRAIFPVTTDSAVAA